MTYATSSAEPSKLLRYSDVTTTLDSFLANAASPLRAALLHFEVTCREPGFRLQVSHVSDWMVTYANQANSVDFWVRQIGLGFLHADSGALLQCIASWAWRAFQIAWNRFVDFAEDTRRKVQDAANRIAVKVGEAYTAAANAVLAAVQAYAADTTLKTGLFFITEAASPSYRLRALALSLVLIDSAVSVQWAKQAPPPEGKPVMSATVPSTMPELYAAIRAVGSKENGYKAVRVQQIGESEYLVLVDGTAWDPSAGSRYATTNMASGLGYDSVYSEQLKKIIQQLPPNSTVHLAGYSMGGHVVQHVGNELAESGTYVIGSVISIAAYYVAKPHPAIGTSRAYLFDNDILNLIDKGGVDNAFRPFGGLDEGLYEEIILHDSGTLDPVKAHLSYDKSKEYDNEGRDKLPFADLSGQTAPAYDFDAPQTAPVTSAVIAAGEWSQTTWTNTTEALAQKQEEIVQSIEEKRNFVVDTADGIADTAATTIRVVRTVKRAADAVTGVLDDAGVL
jgi:hypothetical protein